MRQAISLLLLTAACTGAVASDDLAGDAQRGYELLLNKAYIAPSFDQEVFDQLWQTWEEPLRSWAAKASANKRRRMAFRRYGLEPRPGDAQGRPLQYVVDDSGHWTMNCLSCHQGSAARRVAPGAPNTRYALETLTAEVRATKLRLGKELSDVDLGSLVMPLGTTNGTTNAVMFGVALMSFRDADMNFRTRQGELPLLNHDHDAPAWWNMKYKTRLYSDNFAPRGHRAIMQFIETRANGPEKFREWEDDFRDIEAYIESLEAPRYPFAVDNNLAAQGRAAYERACAECHGEYDDAGGLASYPERLVPIEELGTDPVRLQSLTAEHRRDYERSWVNEYGDKGRVIAEPGGYVAPPLKGVWASAPYFHNGSAPTLWHVLHPERRPVVWTRVDDQNDPRGLDRSADESLAADFDVERVGVAATELQDVPASVSCAAERRRYFDTRRYGKSTAGHEFPAVLTEDERRAVLEYLKTL